MSPTYVIFDVFADTPLQGTSWRCPKTGRGPATWADARDLVRIEGSRCPDLRGEVNLPSGRRAVAESVDSGFVYFRQISAQDAARRGSLVKPLPQSA